MESTVTARSRILEDSGSFSESGGVKGSEVERFLFSMRGEDSGELLAVDSGRYMV